MSKIPDNQVKTAHIAPLEPELLPLLDKTLANLKPLVEYIQLPWYKKLFRKRPTPQANLNQWRTSK